MMDKAYIQQLLEVDKEPVKLTEKKAAILTKAIENFAKYGYAATSTSEIAKQAGVAEGTIFRHYPSKKDLLMAIVKPGILQLAVPYFAEQMIEEVFHSEEVDLEGLLRVFIYNRISFVKKNVQMIRIILQEVAFHPEIQQVFKDIFVTKIYPTVKERLESLQQKGKLKELPIDTSIRFILSTVLGFIFHRYILTTEPVLNEEQEVDYVITLIFHGLQPNHTKG
ncbi:Fatty acid metabolism regulator protein [Paraliobacillus sp. PM-2]|uniref:TetR/AcrR family transcriptional regulator n=1 Tax=Paraliobacillus sp. PM-2 TaxID=1462524 RepID=UPI00061BFC5E|nr:TetR/AcrR family transcriptional regulator [Paraliobacillus sp. PM-2]CQR48312.1 Fatty acid metabolism regulator protein [Paraliobacillus sp. PM-2]